MSVDGEESLSKSPFVLRYGVGSPSGAILTGGSLYFGSGEWSFGSDDIMLNTGSRGTPTDDGSGGERTDTRVGEEKDPPVGRGLFRVRTLWGDV